MARWWYGREGWQSGPIGQDELAGLIHSGKVSADTLLWREGMGDWQPLDALAELAALRRKTPPPLPPDQPPPLPDPPTGTRPAKVPWLRAKLAVLYSWVFAPYRAACRTPIDPSAWPLAGAWRRFSARLFDWYWEYLASALLLGIVVGVAGLLVGPAPAAWVRGNDSGAAIALVCIPLALLLDAGIYALFGNTLGKTMLGLRVGRQDGARLGFVAYLRRNLWMWVKGTGFCLPVVSLFFMAHQGGRLRRGWQASYDAPESVCVWSKPSGWARAAGFAVALMCLFAGVLIFAALPSRQPAHQTAATGPAWVKNAKWGPPAYKPAHPSRTVALQTMKTDPEWVQDGKQVDPPAVAAADPAPHAYPWMNSVTYRTTDIDSAWTYSGEQRDGDETVDRFRTDDGHTEVVMAARRAPDEAFAPLVAKLRKRLDREWGTSLADVEYDVVARRWVGRGTVGHREVTVQLDITGERMWFVTVEDHAPHDAAHRALAVALRASLRSTYF